MTRRNVSDRVSTGDPTLDRLNESEEEEEQGRVHGTVDRSGLRAWNWWNVWSRDKVTFACAGRQQLLIRGIEREKGGPGALCSSLK